MHRARLLVVVAVLSLVACSSSDGPVANPKAACDKLASCNLSSSGFSCDSSSASDCAVCLNDSPCADIASGKCASRCPGATFKQK